MMTDTPQTLEAEDEISLLDLLQTIVDNLRLLIIGPLVVGLAALGISFAVPPTFTATVKFLPPQQQQSAAASMLASLGGLGGLAGAAAGLKSPADQYMAFMKSNSVQDALIERFKLQERYEKKFKDETRLELTGNTLATSGKDGIISLQIDDKDPKFAAELANAHVDELQKLLSRLAVTEAQQRRAFFERQLEQVKDKFTTADQALRAAGVSASVLKSNPSTALSAVAGLKAQVTAQEVKLGAMRGYLAETAPDFKQALAELANLRAQLAKQEKEEPTAAAGQGDYVAKFREYKYQETLFELFARQFEMAKVDESREGAVIQVLDAAHPPERKSKPNKTLIAVITSLATGLVLLIFVFVRQALRNGSKDEETACKLAQIQTSWRRALGRA
jgi:uncharacterized protein involved in exopolysaccharide biosynthesis